MYWDNNRKYKQYQQQTTQQRQKRSKTSFLGRDCTRNRLRHTDEINFYYADSLILLQKSTTVYRYGRLAESELTFWQHPFVRQYILCWTLIGGQPLLVGRFYSYDDEAGPPFRAPGGRRLLKLGHFTGRVSPPELVRKKFDLPNLRTTEKKNINYNWHSTKY